MDRSNDFPQRYLYLTPYKNDVLCGAERLMQLRMFLLFNTSPVVSCDSTMSLDHVSLYRDLKVTEICQHVITCHCPCELMLTRVKMDGKKPGNRSESHIKRTGGARGTFQLLKSGFVISWSA